MRFGLFGTGHWAAETHGAALDAHPRAELVGVWGRNPDRAAALATRYGVPAFAEVDALIEACDAVAVALPPDVQADIAVRAATAGRHLLLDKPLALSVADADRVVEAATRSGVASVVFFTGRYQPEIAGFVAATAAAGGWHTANVLRFASIFQPSSPYGQSPWRRRHGALWDIGPHTLAVLLPVLGQVTRVTAVDGPGGLVHLLLTHDSGAVSSVSLTLDAPPAAVAGEFVLYGEHGVESMPNPNRNPVTAFGVAIDQLLTEVDAGTRDHRCDVRFGREVVTVLAAADTARTRSIPVDLPR
ncbi:Gfo/Idh/MocA family protein [Micromonospora endophytica]|uniref:Oxidoreductase n=1 Tax=Micromonospora endophytica TaxID=515350 RepID=A0A2W2CBE9_9ACTN|nr:Gfo/Idh/MocA family oxidoreductase [Micromonospora endophytica]PZF95862.1 oxidoreductase [Micromonospora endophytica]RIW44484.1 gfo/Idh/MocA family oxidoreductase [Micromonospora endophytica]BCJ60502.1 oxidoreductase [Micromonospora endophytica]